MLGAVFDHAVLILRLQQRVQLRVAKRQVVLAVDDGADSDDARE